MLFFVFLLYTMMSSPPSLDGLTGHNEAQKMDDMARDPNLDGKSGVFPHSPRIAGFGVLTTAQKLSSLQSLCTVLTGTITMPIIPPAIALMPRFSPWSEIKSWTN